MVYLSCITCSLGALDNQFRRQMSALHDGMELSSMR